jgi:phospholipase C
MGTPIQHVVILFKENHTFDNYFGTFPGANGAKMSHSPNPPTKDPDHRHAAWLTRKKTATGQQFLESDIPAYFAYARQFTLCDNYFTDVAGPSTPNHLMAIAADSPIIDNPPSRHPPLYDFSSLPDALEKAGYTWGNYGGYAFDFIRSLKGRNSHPTAQFLSDLQSGKLPAVSWVYAPEPLSEHAPDPWNLSDKAFGNVTLGMQWSVDQVNAIVAAGLWSTVAIFITWDDWGGWQDHVDPPEVEKWTDGTQFRYGSRVPCLVLSPYARKGYISRQLHSHVSMLKFCVANFGLMTWNSRVANADDMSDCFDFTQPPSGPPKAASARRRAGSG